MMSGLQFWSHVWGFFPINFNIHLCRNEWMTLLQKWMCQNQKMHTFLLDSWIPRSSSMMVTVQEVSRKWSLSCLFLERKKKNIFYKIVKNTLGADVYIWQLLVPWIFLVLLNGTTYSLMDIVIVGYS